jgi:hypothetical protein
MKQMTQESDAVMELVRLQREEVAKHKWIESEKAGHDIGWDQAHADWLVKYFAEWEGHLPSRVIDDALHARAPRNRRLVVSDR